MLFRAVRFQVPILVRPGHGHTAQGHHDPGLGLRILDLLQEARPDEHHGQTGSVLTQGVHRGVGRGAVREKVVPVRLLVGGPHEVLLVGQRGCLKTKSEILEEAGNIGRMLRVQGDPHPPSPVQVPPEGIQLFGQEVLRGIDDHHQGGLLGHVGTQTLPKPQGLHLEILLPEDLLQARDRVPGFLPPLPLVGTFPVAGGEIGDPLVGHELEEFVLELLIHLGELAPGLSHFGPDTHHLFPVAITVHEAAVLADAQVLGKLWLHDVIVHMDLHQVRPARQFLEIARQFLQDLVRLRVEQEDLEGLVQVRHEPAGIFARAGGPLKGHVPFPVVRIADVIEEKQAHNQPGNREPASSGEGDPPALDPGCPGHGGGGGLHEEERKDRTQPDDRPQDLQDCLVPIRERRSHHPGKHPFPNRLQPGGVKRKGDESPEVARQNHPLHGPAIPPASGPVHGTGQHGPEETESPQSVQEEPDVRRGSDQPFPHVDEDHAHQIGGRTGQTRDQPAALRVVAFYRHRRASMTRVETMRKNQVTER